LRQLVLTDIHGNLEALEAVLAALSGQWEQCVCLGDVVGYGASPNETAAWVRSNCDVTIRGNHDRACSRLDGVDQFTPLAYRAAHWTYDQLEPDLKEWLANLPTGPIKLDGEILAHGSPLDEDQYVVTGMQARDNLRMLDRPLCLIGHTHLQGGFELENGKLSLFGPIAGPSSLGGEPYDDEGVGVQVVALRPGARYLANPGSVGQPRDGDWRAASLIYDSDAGELTFYRVPYDVETARNKILDAGLPDRLALRLLLGQ
jgi:diadenosine tetraphosphatase ApaH/serine/threonine PP2A family protein phosphatase